MYILMGRSVGVVALLYYNFLILLVTTGQRGEWRGREVSSRERGGAEGRKCLADSGKVTVNNLLCHYLRGLVGVRYTGERGGKFLQTAHTDFTL